MASTTRDSCTTPAPVVLTKALNVQLGLGLGEEKRPWHCLREQGLGDGMEDRLGRHCQNWGCPTQLKTLPCSCASPGDCSVRSDLAARHSFCLFLVGGGIS